jgi:hypothetical protein
MDTPAMTPVPEAKPPVNVFLLVMLLFIVIGVGLILGGWMYLKHTRQFIAHSLVATGRIVDYIADSDDEGTFYKPVVQFTTADGRQIEYHAGSGASFKTKPIGSEVSIHYDPANPEHALIASFLDLWFVPVILFIIGAFFIGIPATILIVVRGKF